MYWKLFVTLLPHLLVCNSLAKPVIYEAVEGDVVAVGSLIREIRQPAPLRVVTEVEDLMSAGNAPQSQDNKKRMKNASGMFLITLILVRIHLEERKKARSSRKPDYRVYINQLARFNV